MKARNNSSPTLTCLNRILPPLTAPPSGNSAPSYHFELEARHHSPHLAIMVSALHFKGDKTKKKRKRVPELDDADVEAKYSKSVATTSGATSTANDDDDSWVNADVPGDISGPILIVLPTEPATCLACDAVGKVFTSTIENFVEGDPSTAEPHDVRQVWVANRVAGTESFSLKGHHGK